MVILPAGVAVGLTAGAEVGLTATVGEIAEETVAVPSTRAGIVSDANTRIRVIRPKMITP